MFRALLQGALNAATFPLGHLPTPLQMPGPSGEICDVAKWMVQAATWTPAACWPWPGPSRMGHNVHLIITEQPVKGQETVPGAALLSHPCPFLHEPVSIHHGQCGTAAAPLFEDLHFPIWLYSGVVQPQQPWTPAGQPGEADCRDSPGSPLLLATCASGGFLLRQEDLHAHHKLVHVIGALLDMLLRLAQGIPAV